ncbi:hypothetical protein C8Q77DRAFT_1162456 [Trametes polyzona]|nr:hypothetical protein C8Q77DRAFT_1162456 [Trametes polyzona]
MAHYVMVLASAGRKRPLADHTARDPSSGECEELLDTEEESASTSERGDHISRTVKPMPLRHRISNRDDPSPFTTPVSAGDDSGEGDSGGSSSGQDVYAGRHKKRRLEGPTKRAFLASLLGLVSMDSTGVVNESITQIPGLRKLLVEYGFLTESAADALPNGGDLVDVVLDAMDDSVIDSQLFRVPDPGTSSPAPSHAEQRMEMSSLWHTDPPTIDGADRGPNEAAMHEEEIDVPVLWADTLQSQVCRAEQDTLMHDNAQGLALTSLDGGPEPQARTSQPINSDTGDLLPTAVDPQMHDTVQSYQLLGAESSVVESTHGVPPRATEADGPSDSDPDNDLDGPITRRDMHRVVKAMFGVCNEGTSKVRGLVLPKGTMLSMVKPITSQMATVGYIPQEDVVESQGMYHLTNSICGMMSESMQWP